MALAGIKNIYKEQGSNLLDACARIFDTAKDRDFPVTINLDALREQLNEPFSIFVCGEFNSGKSSLLNTLAGSQLAQVGILPTTADLQALSVPELPTLRFIDSPGTNSIHDSHQEVTRTYLELSDIVLFVTSVERPFSESEAQFLKRIHSIWQRSIVVAINKIDLLDTPEAREEICSYVQDGFQRMVETSPPIFAISAKTGEGVKELETSLRERLTESEQLRLKNKSIQETVRVHLRELEEHMQQRLQHMELEKRVLEKSLARVQSRFQESDIFFDLYKEKISHIFHTGSTEFARLLEEHFGIVSALKTRVFGKQDQVKQKVRTLVDQLHLEEKLGSVVSHAVTTFQDFQGRIIQELQEDLDLAQELALEGLDLPELTYTSIDEQTLAREFLEGTEQGLNKFFMYSSLAAATGIGISIAQTAALVDISGLLTVILLTTLGMRALPREKKRIQEEVNKQFKAVADSCHQSLESSLRLHVNQARKELEQHFTPFLKNTEASIQSCQELQKQIASHHDAIDTFLNELEASS